MLRPSLVILYVDNPQKSAEFYSHLFDKIPIETSETFVMYAFEKAWKLGLWSKHSVKPKARKVSECCEIAIALPNTEAIDTLHQQLKIKGIASIQAPAKLDFGYTFTLLDPNGHRLRFYNLG